MISLIVAVDENNGIGKDNKLLCSIPIDMKRFISITKNKTIVMGRKTWDSLPNKPLKNRTNIVITSKNIPEVITFSNPLDILKIAENEEIIIIGGESIYKIFLQYANKIYLTIIHSKFEADTFFPNFDRSKWKIEEIEHIKKSKDNEYELTFLNLIK